MIPQREADSLCIHVYSSDVYRTHTHTGPVTRPHHVHPAVQTFYYNQLKVPHLFPRPAEGATWNHSDTVVVPLCVCEVHSSDVLLLGGPAACDVLSPPQHLRSLNALRVLKIRKTSYSHLQ